MSKQKLSDIVSQFPMLSDEDGIATLTPLSQVFVDLLCTTAIVAKHKAALNNADQTAPNHAVSTALDAIRLSTQTCHKLAAAIMGAAPASELEATLRSEALAAYLILFDADELRRSLHIDVSSTLAKNLTPTVSYVPPLPAVLFDAAGSAVLSPPRHTCDAKQSG